LVDIWVVHKNTPVAFGCFFLQNVHQSQPNLQQVVNRLGILISHKINFAFLKIFFVTYDIFMPPVLMTHQCVISMIPLYVEQKNRTNMLSQNKCHGARSSLKIFPTKL